MKRVLLTGAFGGVGAFVRDAVVAEGHTLRCLDLPTPRNRKLARGLPDGVEVVWADLRDADAVRRAMQDIDVVLHVAFVVFPLTERDPVLAEAVNIDGSRHLLTAARAQPTPPRFVFCSSYHVHPFVPNRCPPITVDEPTAGTDLYARHKLQVEAMVRDSGLRWSVLRLSSVMLDRKLDAENLRIMFDIPLGTRLEMVDPADAGLAFARAVTTEAIDGRTLFIGGGPRCQQTYEGMYRHVFSAVGLPMLPEAAFQDERPFIGDWLDTTESEALLRYQRHSLDDYYDRMRAGGLTRLATQLTGPLVVRWMVRHSPHLHKGRG